MIPCNSSSGNTAVECLAGQGIVVPRMVVTLHPISGQFGDKYSHPRARELLGDLGANQLRLAKPSADPLPYLESVCTHPKTSLAPALTSPSHTQ